MSNTMSDTGPADSTSYGSTTGGTGVGTSGSGPGETSASSTGEPACEITIPCQDLVYDCGNGMDDDFDGLVDLDDPDCVGPCDVSEYAFGPLDHDDNPECIADCAFDANAGIGNDMCAYDARCDPLTPVLWCEFAGEPWCSEGIVSAPPECVDFCEPLVPNGCDCFGCCELATVDGPTWYFLEDQNGTCTTADGLAGCEPCTPHIELCGNPCDVDACEVCIGEDGPPPGCDAVGCVDGTPCETSCDCGEGEACVTGCCTPPVR